MLIKDYFSTRLAEARKQQGLTKRALASAIGISERAIGQMEQGTYFPSLPVAVALADALDISLDWLCGRSDKIPPS